MIVFLEEITPGISSDTGAGGAGGGIDGCWGGVFGVRDGGKVASGRKRRSDGDEDDEEN